MLEGFLPDGGEEGQLRPGAVSGFVLPGPEGQDSTMRGQRGPLVIRTTARAGAGLRARTPPALISEPRTGRDCRVPEAEAAAGADASASCEAAPGLTVAARL
eukprot:9794262-Alexandrium_andersonii.AAC.1